MKVNLDLKPRTLHIAESLESINFDDPEPAVVQPNGEALVACEFFKVDRWQLEGSRNCEAKDRFAVFMVAEGEVTCGEAQFRAGSLFLMPAGSDLELQGSATLLRTTI